MKWVLMAWIVTSQGATGVTAEFNYQSACQYARAQLPGNLVYRQVFSICVPKGTDRDA